MQGQNELDQIEEESKEASAKAYDGRSDAEDKDDG